MSQLRPWSSEPRPRENRSRDQDGEHRYMRGKVEFGCQGSEGTTRKAEEQRN